MVWGTGLIVSKTLGILAVCSLGHRASFPHQEEVGRAVGSRALFTWAAVSGGVHGWRVQSAVVKQRGCLRGRLSWPGWQGGEPGRAVGREAMETPRSE